MYSKLLLSQEPNIWNKAQFIQFSTIRIFVEDKDRASMAKNKNGKQYGFNSSTEIISEFKALDLMTTLATNAFNST